MSTAHQSGSAFRRSAQGPSWRSTLVAGLVAGAAEQVARGNKGEVPRSADEYVRRAFEHFIGSTSDEVGSSGSGRPQSEIARAAAINEDSSLCEPLKILCLANCPRPEKIAARLGLQIEAIVAWEALHFDVREMLAATSWIAGHVIHSEQSGGNEALAAKMKLAWCGGPRAAWAILDAESRVPLTEAERLFDRKVQLDAKFEAALAVPLDSDRAKVRFVRMYVNLQLAQERVRLAEQRLALRCERESRKHELALLRLQNAGERERRRAAESARNEEAKCQQQLAREQQRELYLQQRLAEQQSAVEGAEASPLAQLRWCKAPVPLEKLVSEAINASLPQASETQLPSGDAERSDADGMVEDETADVVVAA